MAANLQLTAIGLVNTKLLPAFAWLCLAFPKSPLQNLQISENISFSIHSFSPAEFQLQGHAGGLNWAAAFWVPSGQTFPCSNSLTVALFPQASCQLKALDSSFHPINHGSTKKKKWSLSLSPSLVCCIHCEKWPLHCPICTWFFHGYNNKKSNELPAHAARLNLIQAHHLVVGPTSNPMGMMPVPALAYIEILFGVLDLNLWICAIELGP